MRELLAVLLLLVQPAMAMKTHKPRKAKGVRVQRRSRMPRSPKFKKSNMIVKPVEG